MSFKPKVGIISCNGEDCSGGNVSRAATLRVLHNLRPGETVTICLPLFLAGDENERGFAKVFPTITVDGCNKLCAAKGTARYSSEPAAKVNVEDYMTSPCADGSEKWHIGESSTTVEKLANDIAVLVDRLRDEWRLTE